MRHRPASGYRAVVQLSSRRMQKLIAPSIPKRPALDRRVELPPTANGGIARAACARAKAAGLDIDPFLKQANLTLRQINNADVRIAVKNQVAFLNLLAVALEDDFLGICLAEILDLRELGLLYYVLASSKTLGDALKRVARYSGIHNEGVHITYREGNNATITFEYVGIARLSDRHQIEFFVAVLLRLCRELTARTLSPVDVSLRHPRGLLPAKIRAFFACEVVFGSPVDQVVFPLSIKDISIVGDNSYLNSLLQRFCDEALAKRRIRHRDWRGKIENAITPLSPHGQANVTQVAQQLAVSRRTLARRLKSEGSTFAAVLNDVRQHLAKRYLQERRLQISEVAWLLGFREASAFSHAFRRWTGCTPKQWRVRNRSN